MRGTLATCPDCGCQGRFSRPKILPVDFHKKILRLEELAAWRAGLRDSVKKLVVTNGCFDLIHIGHVTYLQAARGQGDALLVGLNGDASVRALKGPGRPINSEGDRAGVLAALESVDAVCIFPEDRATAFLRLAKPDIYVKGGDYTPETLNAEERSAVESGGGRIVIVPVVPGKSTTRLLQRLAQ
ncbi:MAG: adenylyltransferase/cytidyltransferase family protein [Verrucomicrobia bacterium]|nr:adenylyltransferase/cytidyltransferase family protein [Verrucomicrobiota bacterium]